MNSAQAPDVRQLAAQLSGAVWGLSALSCAFEAGLVDSLDQPRTAAEVGCRTGAPPLLVEAVLDVLLALGLVRRAGETFAAEPGLVPATRLQREAIQGLLRSVILQGAQFVEGACEGSLHLGWQHTALKLLEAQGMLSAGQVEAWVDHLLPSLEGLQQRLQEPGARFLDVGTGIGAIGIEMARRFPHLQVVGIDPWEPALAEARRNIDEAGLGDRISVRPDRVEELDDQSCFDLAQIPIQFLTTEVLARGLRRVRRALRPGGWVLLQVVAAPERDLKASVSRLWCVLWGSEALVPEQAKHMLDDAGYASVAIVPPLPGMPRWVVGRRHLGEQVTPA